VASYDGPFLGDQGSHVRIPVIYNVVQIRALPVHLEWVSQKAGDVPIKPFDTETSRTGFTDCCRTDTDLTM
jgi:hypothetical protein